MKFTPEVIAALQTLKDAAENDFELHRISVLEKDLTAPPTVEVIDDNHQKFNGIVYYKNKFGYYVFTTSIYRAVYSYCCGEIIDGNSIHHIDHNTDNNMPKNLIQLPRTEHAKKHRKRNSEITVECRCCGKMFKTFEIENVYYCSNQCRDSSVKEKRKCVICGKLYSTGKYSNGKTCSRACARKLGSINHPTVEKICPLCGAKFLAKNPKKIFCSQKCAVKFSEIKKRRD